METRDLNFHRDLNFQEWGYSIFIYNLHFPLLEKVLGRPQ